jgi:hypothetical protein
LALVTINLGATHAIAEIGSLMKKSRRDLRNMIDKCRRASVHWWPFEVLGWMEVDAFDLDDFLHLGPQKRNQIEQFIQVFHGSAGVVWCPHLHCIVRLAPGLDASSVRSAFERQWPGEGRVDVSSFSEQKTVQLNIGDIVNYSLKHACTTEFYDDKTGSSTICEWRTTWQCEYFLWMHKWSRGFQSTRVSIRPRTTRKKS